ncbi:hypothetical protein [Xylanivirga thermophila]|uniref:hypothetical protein n=1 Tax=Xylanivirga thermophila TaxID=2496273 RepID=UPI00101CF379|nr:hypothetical protein [Xylanivirga thermophila]
MLLYLTSNENLGLFDFLTDENGMLVKKLSGEFLLKKFVVHDMRNLSHFSYIAIDLEAIKDSEDDIIEAIKAFKTMYDSRIIIFAEKTDRALLDRIIDETETYNIVTAQTVEKIKKEILVCVSPLGMTKDYLIKSMNLDLDIVIEDYLKYSFMGDSIKIMVAGSMPRVGTTTTAINMACYLSSIGAKVSYTEANDSGHLSQIHSCFFSNIPINDNYFTYSNVDYFFNSSIPVGMEYNFNIIDIGILKEKNVKLFGIGDLKLLCGGTKPYEINELKATLQLIDYDKNFNIILPEALTDIKKGIPIKERVYSSKISADLFNSDINSKIWRTILSEYIVPKTL